MPVCFSKPDFFAAVYKFAGVKNLFSFDFIVIASDTHPSNTGKG